MKAEVILVLFNSISLQSVQTINACYLSAWDSQVFWKIGSPGAGPTSLLGLAMFHLGLKLEPSLNLKCLTRYLLVVTLCLIVLLLENFKIVITFIAQAVIISTHVFPDLHWLVFCLNVD